MMLSAMKKAAITVAPGSSVAALMVWSFLSSWSCIGRPFLGFLVYPNLLVAPLYLPWWIPPQEGGIYPWTLESIDAMQVHSFGEMDTILATLTPGDIHMLTLRKGNDRRVKGFPVTIFHTSDFLGICGPLFVASLILIAIGIFVGISAPRGPPSWSLSAFCLFLAGWMGTYPDWLVSHRIPVALLLFCSFSPAAVAGLALSFPFPLARLRGRSWPVPLIVCIIGSTVFILFLLSLPSTTRYAWVDTLNTALVVLYISLLGLRLTKIVISAQDPRKRRIARISLVGGLIPFGLMFPFVVVQFFFHTPFFLFAFVPPLTALFPAAMAWGLSTEAM